MYQSGPVRSLKFKDYYYFCLISFLIKPLKVPGGPDHWKMLIFDGIFHHVARGAISEINDIMLKQCVIKPDFSFFVSRNCPPPLEIEDTIKNNIFQWSGPPGTLK